MENNLSISIIIPCYNEKETIEKVFFKVKSSHIHNKEIIIVDDFSNDGSVEIINKISKDNSESKLKTIFHKKNEGKGAAIKSGLKVATCDLVLIQDSDLEYDPSDYPNLLEPFIKYNADVVYGSRFVGGKGPKRLHLFWHTFANKILTLITNIFTNLNMTDMETGYKVFKKKYIDIDNLEEKSFGIEPEITIKLAKQKIKFFEVPITYNGRNYNQGKKIKAKDAFIALYCIIKYSLFR
jgi:glycosyltransferase involved in cell wall biosynthesis